MFVFLVTKSVVEIDEDLPHSSKPRGQMISEERLATARRTSTSAAHMS